MTGQKSTDIDLYRVHVMLLNSERTTIWQRFNALLVANSVMLVFLKGHPLLLPIVGLVLSGIWLLIHLAGYRLFSGQLNTVATEFEFHPMPGTPVYGREGRQGSVIDWIFWCSVALILVYITVYILLLLGIGDFKAPPS